MTKVTLAAIALAFTMAAPAHAGITFNGHSLNGKSLNGITFNGRSLNGKSLNGITFNGHSLNGRSINGKSLNGTALNSMSPAPDSSTLVGVELAH